jgi:peptidoglycan-associated lipoprotein
MRADTAPTPDFPSVSGDSTNSELSGFSQNPSEERLSQSGFVASLSPSEPNVRRRAELVKEKEERTTQEASLEDVFFSYDQWNVSDAGMLALNHDAGWLKEHPGTVMTIEGHCDERGTAAYNMVLGDKRAKSARAYLIELGINPEQVATVTYGKERPFCSEHDESCYQQNRRGHMRFRTQK